MSRKPLVLWAARKQWTLRFSGRTPTEVTGTFSTADGPVAFRYDQEKRRIYLPSETILVNDFGWEVDEKGRTVFRSVAPHKSAAKPSETKINDTSNQELNNQKSSEEENG